MPKETYYHLEEEKRKKIYNVLVEEFKEKSINEATVTDIVTKLNIPRGSFYQYFDSIYESYFYVLSKEIRDLHCLLSELINKYSNDFQNLFVHFGKEIISELFDERKYYLYKNRYLYFDASIEEKWKDYFQKNNILEEYPSSLSDKEKIRFIGSIIHSLIKRLFQENWSEEEFLNKYEMYIEWIMKGVN